VGDPHNHDADAGTPSVRGCHLQGKGYERYYPPTNFFAEEHTTCVDGRATARHLHGITERAARCDTVKVSAESADAVAR